MFTVLPEYKIYFYIAPLLVFGPIFFAVLWNFGLKNIFHTPPEIKLRQRQERAHAERMALRREKKAGFHGRSVHAGTKPSAYWLAQGALYAVFAGFLGVFSAALPYQFAAGDQAQIKLSLSHPGTRLESCRTRSREELAKLAPNMQAKKVCSRARHAVRVDMELDGKLVFKGRSEPMGLHADGVSSFYEKFRVATGWHTVTVRLNDAGPGGAVQSLRFKTRLAPLQNLVIGFHEDGRGLYWKR